MTEEQNTEATTEETESVSASTEVDDKAVRTHPLFKKVTSQQKEELKALKAQVSELLGAHEQKEQEIAAAKAAEEGRLTEHYTAQLNTMKAQIEAFDVERVRIATEYELKIAAANKGITSPIIQKGLLSEYLALEGDDRVPPDKWVESLAENEEHSSLFAATQKATVGAGVPGRVSSRAVGKVSLKERLKDPYDAEAFQLAREMAARGETIE